MPPQPAIDKAIEGIADGVPLDWQAIGSDAGAGDRELLECLRLLGDIAGVCRSSIDDTEEIALPQPAVTAAPDAAPDDSESWGRYRLTEKVGEGSFGSVYRAWDPDLQREIAIKILHNRVADAHIKERLLAEGRALAKVRHPNVVSVFGVEAHGDRVGLCMEFVHGSTLESELASRGAFNERDAIGIGRELSVALAAVHAAGFVHRDVKGRNVMRGDDGRIVLMDFGTGRGTQELKAGARAGIAGTPLYMAPEVLAGLPASEASDLYSVGVLLFRLVTAAYPVEGRSIDELRAAHMQGRRHPVSEYRAGVSRSFVRVVDAALSADPQRRYPTAEAFGEALAGLSRKARVLRALRLVTMVTCGPPVLLAILGLFTTYPFNNMLGRFAPFNHDPPLLLVKLGWQSAFSTLLGAALIAGIVGATGRLFRPLAKLVAGMAARAGLEDPVVLAQAAGALSVLALGALIWGFSDVILACLSNVNTSSLDRLAPLQEGQTGRAFLYRLSLDALAVGLASTLVRISRLRARQRAPRSAWTVAPLAAILLVTVALSELPYRIIWKSQAERIAFGGDRCYVLGESNEESSIYCPDKAPPRNRIVKETDPALRRTGITESIFSLPDASR